MESGAESTWTVGLLRSQTKAKRDTDTAAAVPHLRRLPNVIHSLKTRMKIANYDRLYEGGDECCKTLHDVRMYTDIYLSLQVRRHLKQNKRSGRQRNNTSGSGSHSRIQKAITTSQEHRRSRSVVSHADTANRVRTDFMREDTDNSQILQTTSRRTFLRIYIRIYPLLRFKNDVKACIYESEAMTRQTRSPQNNTNGHN
jgi:hypothetical protein